MSETHRRERDPLTAGSETHPAPGATLTATGRPRAHAVGQPRLLNSRRSADRAAQTPHMPWTPPPGGVDEEHR